MRDLDRALTDISVIREQLAQSTEFQGYAPATLATTGVFALLVAAAQGSGCPNRSPTCACSFPVWVGTAAVCVVITAIETIRRSRRGSRWLRPAMLQSALEQFVPAIVAGGLLTMALLEVAPQDLWMIPGPLAHRLQPGRVCFAPLPAAGGILGRVWFLGCGLACLALAAPTHTNSPWAMGIPYGVGHLLVAGILQYRRQLESSR
jgi:hypothetical protein